MPLRRAGSLCSPAGPRGRPELRFPGLALTSLPQAKSPLCCPAGSWPRSRLSPARRPPERDEDPKASTLTVRPSAPIGSREGGPAYSKLR